MNTIRIETLPPTITNKAAAAAADKLRKLTADLAAARTEVHQLEDRRHQAVAADREAFGKALAEAFQVGLIAKLPQIVTVQAAGAAPFAAYYESGFDHYEPVQAETIATAIKIGDPASLARARRSIELTGGIVTSVPDEDLLDAKALIDRIGIGCEPASAASLAGVRKLVAEGRIAADANVVGVVTANILKDTDTIVTYHLDDDKHGQRRAFANRPISIPAELDALKRVLDDAVHG